MVDPSLPLAETNIQRAGRVLSRAARGGGGEGANLEGLLITLMPLLLHSLAKGACILVQLLIHTALAPPLPLCQLLQPKGYIHSQGDSHGGGGK